MSILSEADELINGERQNDYGPPKECFERIAAIWSAVLGIEITPDQVVLCMIGLKVARGAAKTRMGVKPTRDTYKDIAGYAGLPEKMAESFQTVVEEFLTTDERVQYKCTHCLYAVIAASKKEARGKLDIHYMTEHNDPGLDF